MKHSLIPAVMLSLLATQGVFAQKAYVAISKFEDRVTSNYYDRHFRLQQIDNIRQRITDAVVNTRKFEVIERERIADILKEHSLKEGGVTADDKDDPNTPETGKIKSVGYIMYGAVLSLGENAAAAAVGGGAAQTVSFKTEIQIRLTDVETGKILASKTVQGVGKATKTVGAGMATDGNLAEQALRDACQDASTKVVAMLMELAFPAKIIKVGRKDITINVTEEMCKLGEVWEVIETGDELTDPDTGESLGSEEEEVGLVKITKPGPKFSKAEPFDNPDLLDDLEEGMLVRRVTKPIKPQKPAKPGRF